MCKVTKLSRVENAFRLITSRPASSHHFMVFRCMQRNGKQADAHRSSRQVMLPESSIWQIMIVFRKVKKVTKIEEKDSPKKNLQNRTFCSGQQFVFSNVKKLDFLQ